MPRKLKGGKIIRCGSYGCVFKPALHCNGSSNDGKVTKVITSYGMIEEELKSDMDPSKIQALINNDPERDFVLYGESLAGCELSTLTEEQLQDLYFATFKDGNYENLEKFNDIKVFYDFKNYVLKHGLKDFGFYNMIEAKPYPENYKFQKHDCDMLVNCVRFIHALGFAHSDLHSGNFLQRTRVDKEGREYFEPVLIDLGQSRWFEGQFLYNENDNTVAQLEKVPDELSYKNSYLTYKDYLYFYYDIKQFGFNYKQRNYFPLVPLAKFRIVVEYIKPLFSESVQPTKDISHSFEAFGFVMKDNEDFQTFFRKGIDGVMDNFSKFAEPAYGSEKYVRGDMSRRESKLLGLINAYEDKEVKRYAPKQFYIEYFADFTGFYIAPEFRGYILFNVGFYKFFFEEVHEKKTKAKPGSIFYNPNEEEIRTQVIFSPTIGKHKIIRNEDKDFYFRIFKEAVNHIRIYRLLQISADGYDDEILITMNPKYIFYNFVDVIKEPEGFFQIQCIKVEGKEFVVSHQVDLQFNGNEVYHNDKNYKDTFKDNYFMYFYEPDFFNEIEIEPLDQNHFKEKVRQLIDKELNQEQKSTNYLSFLEKKQPSRPDVINGSDDFEYAKSF